MRKIGCLRPAAWFLTLGVFLLTWTAPAAAEKKNLKFGADWAFYGVHAPFFVAQEKGFYEAQGLKVKLSRGFGSAGVLKELVAGTNDLGFGDAGATMLGRSKGHKAKLVGVFYEQAPFLIYTKKNSGITKPKDLEGKRIGVQEYRQSAAVWIRGMLADEYGVDLAGITWFEGGVDAPRRADEDMDLRPAAPLDIHLIGPEASLGDMLAAGEIDALIGARRPRVWSESPMVERLFPDYRALERDYFTRTGIFPIMHTVVIRDDLYDKSPWVAESLCKACAAAKNLAGERMRFSGAMRYMLPWLYDDIDEIDAVFGGDPFAYGLAPNRATLETLVRYLQEQSFISGEQNIEDFFAPIVGWQE